MKKKRKERGQDSSSTGVNQDNWSESEKNRAIYMTASGPDEAHACWAGAVTEVRSASG